MLGKQRKSYISSDQKLSQRIAEEAQLLAEERWIIDALKKVKTQRNGLQIERLHLENMRNQIGAEQNKNETVVKKVPEKNTDLMDLPDILESLLMQTNNANCVTAPFPDFGYNDACNAEELNLSVTNSIFDTEQYTTGCGDEEEDEEDMENCLLDMDLLMSGK